jgi:hypothetical protein
MELLTYLPKQLDDILSTLAFWTVQVIEKLGLQGE